MNTTSRQALANGLAVKATPPLYELTQPRA